MAIVAQEAGVVVVALDMVRGEVEPITHILPARDQSSYIIIHRQVGIPVDLSAHQAQIPPPGVVRIVEIPKVEGLRGRNDEVIPDPRVLIHVPVRGPGEEHTVVPPTPGIVILLG
jgi:hypothetical protein